MESRSLKTLEYHKIIDKLVNYAVSPMAKEIAGELIPTDDYNEIIQRQKETSYALTMMIKKGTIPLGGFKDIRSSIKRVDIGGILTAAELMHMADFLYVCKKVKNYYKDDKKEESYGSLDALFEGITTLPALEREISRCILSEEEIADDASPALSNIRKEIKGMN